MNRPIQQPYLWNGVYQQPMQPPPLPPPVIPDYQTLLQRLCQSEQKLIQVSEQITGLQKQIDDLKSKTPLHVEYHFDQLKINRLEGTLNVGLSPQGVEGIESFQAPDPSCWNIKSDQPDEPLPPIRALQNEMSEYMHKDSANVLLEMERQQGVQLDQAHRTAVIEDVTKQLNDRVHYYAKMNAYPGKGTEEERLKWNESIKEKTRRDIQSAFSAYIGKLKKGGEAPT